MKKPLIDVESNRSSIKWSLKEKIGRVLWASVYPFFRFSPRVFWWWRRSLLRIFGAKIGEQVHIYPSVRILIPWNLRIGGYSAIGDSVILYSLGEMTIGEYVTVSQGVHLCGGSHNWKDPGMELIKAEVVIENNTWICADSFVGPGVVVGRSSIVSARSVVFKNVDSGSLVRGNPAFLVRKI